MKKQTEKELIQKLRGSRSFREFESYLNENIPTGMPGTTTFASAWNWVNDVYNVNGACLMAWMAFYPESDPRHHLAKEILALRLEDEDAYSPEDQKKIMNILQGPREKECVR